MFLMAMICNSSALSCACGGDRDQKGVNPEAGSSAEMVICVLVPAAH